MITVIPEAGNPFGGSLRIETPIPITLHWSFLALVGYFAYSAGDEPQTWIITGFVLAVSVLLHEIGHAVVARRYGRSPAIVLGGYGGKTTAAGPRFAYHEDMLFAVSGPLVNIVLSMAGFLAGYILRRIAADGFLGREIEIPWMLYLTCLITAHANLMLAKLNLVPALPFDGGHILRANIERFFPEKSRWTYRVSAAACALIGGWAAFQQDWMLMGFAVFMIAGNVQTLRRLHLISDAELHPENQAIIEKAIEREGAKDPNGAYGIMRPLLPILGPLNTHALAGYACDSGRYQEALDIERTLHVKLPNDLAVTICLARASAGLGDRAAAATWVGKAVKLGIVDPMPWLKNSIELSEIWNSPEILKARGIDSASDGNSEDRRKSGACSSCGAPQEIDSDAQYCDQCATPL